MTLCSRCKNFDVQTFADGFPLRGYVLKAVIDAAASGCTFCSLLLENIKAVTSDDAQAGLRPLLGLEGGTPPRRISKSSFLDPFRIHFYITKSEETPDEEERALRMSHLNAVAGLNAWTLEPSKDVVSFHTAADLGESVSSGYELKALTILLKEHRRTAPEIL